MKRLSGLRSAWRGWFERYPDDHVLIGLVVGIFAAIILIAVLAGVAQ